jgi:hypothetical protein
MVLALLPGSSGSSDQSRASARRPWSQIGGAQVLLLETGTPASRCEATLSGRVLEPPHSLREQPVADDPHGAVMWPCPLGRAPARYAGS